MITLLLFLLACTGAAPPAPDVETESTTAIDVAEDEPTTAIDIPADDDAPTPPPDDAAPVEQATPTVELVARGGGCSRRRCPPTDPCCNTCSFQGWFTADGTQAAGDLPTCEVDGCGNCAFTLEAQGAVEGGTFQVTSWAKR